MGKESIVMKELREIRNKNYEATKNMTIQEEIAYIRAKADMGKKRMEELKKQEKVS